MIRKKKINRRPKENRFQKYTEIFMRLSFYKYNSESITNSNIYTETIKEIITPINEDIELNGYVPREQIETPKTKNKLIAEACNMKWSHKQREFIGKCPYGSPKAHYIEYLNNNPIIISEKRTFLVQRKDGKGKYFRDVVFYALKTDPYTQFFLQTWFKYLIHKYPAHKKDKLFGEQTAKDIQDMFFNSDYYNDSIPEDIKSAINKLGSVKEDLEFGIYSGTRIVIKNDIDRMLKELDEVKQVIVTSLETHPKELNDAWKKHQNGGLTPKQLAEVFCDVSGRIQLYNHGDETLKQLGFSPRKVILNREEINDYI